MLNEAPPTSSARWCRASRDRSPSGPVDGDAPDTVRTSPQPAAASSRVRRIARRDPARHRAASTPAHHRGEIVALVDGVRFVDNSKAHATCMPRWRRSRGSRARLIAGGRARAWSLSPLRDRADRLAGVVALGESAPEIGATFDGLVPVPMRPRSRRRPWRRSRWRLGPGRSCSHRPAPAGTCSAITQNEATVSRRRRAR